MVFMKTAMLVPTEPTCADDLVLCIVRDMTDVCRQDKQTFNLPSTFTCGQLLKDVAERLGYEADSFLLTYEQPAGAELQEIVINEVPDNRLEEVCVNCGNGKRNTFTVMDKDGRPPVKLESSTHDAHESSVSDATLDASASAMPSSSLNVGLATQTTSDSTYSSSTYGPSFSSSYGYSYASSLIKSDTGYVGLVNQAMTCYLNSLLQTLFMTPEFRNAVYRWGFDGTEEEAAKSIPYQLQKLFVQLQTSKRRAVETTDITKSFGWDSSEAWQQHDVQELCRVMFDALEKKWRNTDQADLINQLYQGKVKDYVKCLECGNESARTDTYLDIPLVIRPFGSHIAYDSVERALNAFVEPEILDGNNQYFCEKCDKKCNAHKGLKFLSFPYFLTLQLKRFDFDYVSLHRIKLNDRMTFPEILNLNHLIEGTTVTSRHQGDGGNGAEPADKVTDHSPGAASSPSQTMVPADEGTDEGIDIGYSASGTSTASSDVSSISSTDAAANDKNAKDSKKRGPNEYELFSIMIHSGSAAGGHYYAYIKSFKDGQWYSFNDQHVSTITYDDIKKTHGGSSSSRGYYSSAYTSSTNAYMLMYRQIDKERNRDFYQESDFPQHLKDSLSRMKEQEEADRLQREMDKNVCKIRLFCFHPEHSKLLESRLEIHKDKTLQEATEIAWRQFDLEKIVPLDCVRIVKYDETLDYIDQSYDHKEDMPMGQLLGGVKSFYAYELLLELKSPSHVFLEYKQGDLVGRPSEEEKYHPSPLESCMCRKCHLGINWYNLWFTIIAFLFGVTVKVYLVDLDTETIGPPITVRAYLTQTIDEFKTLVSQVTTLPKDSMRCVRERYYNDLRLLVTPGRTLKAEGFTKSNKVFVECSGAEDDSMVIFDETKLFKLLDRYENTIRLHLVLPTLVQGQSDYPSVPSSSSNQVPAASSQSAPTNKSHDVDEGIDEVDADKPHSCVTESARESGSGDGPLNSSSLKTGENPGEIHSLIGDTSNTERLAPDGQEGPSVSNNSDSLGENESYSMQTSLQSSMNSSQNVSPEDCNKGLSATKDIMESWDLDDPVTNDWERTLDDEYRRYFTAQLHINAQSSERTLTVYVDKRITLGSLKKELEQYVGTASDCFKIYRVYSNSQEVEVTRLSETLTTYSDDSKLAVKIGRALKKGEYRVKVYQLQVNEEEVIKFLVEAIFARGMTVYESKKIVQKELKTHCDMDVSLNRCRLRKKSWKNPSKIYQENLVYDRDITIMTNWELFLEILDGPETVTDGNQLSVYVRRWWPSKYIVDPLQEIVLSEQTLEELRQKISDISGISVENVEFAKAKGTFPCEMSILDIHADMDWNVPVTSLNMYPLSVCEDGAVLYYRDKSEQLMELSSAKKKELQQKENSRMSLYTTRTHYSPRKERALKIYTDDAPSTTTNSSNNALPSDLD